MKYVIDRFEGKYAILEDENKMMIDILISDLPEGMEEGDVLIKEGDVYVIDQLETQRRKEKLRELMDDLWE